MDYFLKYKILIVSCLLCFSLLGCNLLISMFDETTTDYEDE
jgi:hypothetical protein